MPDYLSGTAYVQVVPSLRTFQTTTEAELAAMDVTMEVRLVPKLDPDATLPPAEEGGQRTGVAFADAFDRAVQSRVRDALSALPKVDVNADTTEAAARVDNLRAQLEELSRQRVGIDVDAGDALALVESIRAELAEVAHDAQSIQLRVDAAAAEAALERVAEQVNQLDGRDAVVHVQYDVDQASLVRAEGALGSSGGAGLNIGQAGALAGGLALGAPAATGLALAAIPVAIAAIAGEAEKTDTAVQTSLADMTDAAKTTARDGFAPLDSTLVQLAQDTRSTIAGLKPEIAQASIAAAPLVQIMGDDLLQAARKGVGVVDDELGQLRPLAQAVGDDFDRAEQAVAGFARNLDVGEAAQGVRELGSFAQAAGPAVGSLLSDVLPLANAAGSVLAPAVKDLATDASILRPELQAVDDVVQVLAPGIAAVAPPALAVMAASKLLTGSWTDLSGAGQKLLSPFRDWDATLGGLANKVGITTAAQNAAIKVDLEAAAAKARLQAAADAEAVAALKAAGAAQGTAAEQLALAEAQSIAAASADAAAEAETAAAAATERLEVSLGPIGIVLAVVGVALSGFIGQGDQAATTAQDLSEQIIRLGNAAPSTAASLLGGNQDLQKIAGELTQVGSSATQFATAYSGSLSSAQVYTDGLADSQKKLGETIIGVSGDSSHFYQVQNLARAQSVSSLKELTDEVNKGTVAYDLLDPRLKKQVDQYNAYNDVLPQARNALASVRAEQQAEVDALASQGIVLTQNQKDWQSYATAVATRVSAFNDQTGAIKGLTDNLLSADSTFQQAQATFQQLDQAVTQAEQAHAQAHQNVLDAQHSAEQASQSVADARHSEEQATLAVGTAEESLAAAQRSERQAQEQLISARQQAAKQLADLRRQVTDQADTEDEARVRLVQAQQAVRAAGLGNRTLASLGAPTEKNLANYQLLLQLREAQHALNDALAQGASLRAQEAAADRAGINGSTQVVQAQDQLRQAKQGVASASKGVTDAQYAEDQAHKATSNAIDAEQQASRALRNAVNQETIAKQAVTIAKQNDSRETDINTAAGLRNFQTIENLFEANFKATGNIDLATQATERQGAKMHIAKGDVDSVITSITSIPATTKFSIVGIPSMDIDQLVASARNAGIDPFNIGLSRGQVNNALRDIAGHAAGGPVEGPGTPTSDSILIRASTGEFVQQAAATDYYGVGFMHALNRMQIPREALPGFAGGGLVDANAHRMLQANYWLLGWDTYLQGFRNVLAGFGVPNLPSLAPPGSISFASLGAISSGPLSAPARAGVAAQAQAYARSQFGRFGWGPEQMPPLIALWNQESGWNPWAVNPSSGAYGIPQSLGHGHPYNLGDFVAQVNWGEQYIRERYGTPAAAEAHELAFHWYDDGGWMPPGWNAVFNGTGGPEPVLNQQQWSDIQGAAAAGSGPHDFVGELYLDSGEWLGRVRGVVQEELEDTGTAIARGTR